MVIYALWMESAARRNPQLSTVSSKLVRRAMVGGFHPLRTCSRTWYSRLSSLFFSRRDEIVRQALGGGSLEGGLVRVAATGALARSREAALDYASRARSFLGPETYREELEVLTYAVVDRAS